MLQLVELGLKYKCLWYPTRHYHFSLNYPLMLIFKQSILQWDNESMRIEQPRLTNEITEKLYFGDNWVGPGLSIYSVASILSIRSNFIVKPHLDLLISFLSVYGCINNALYTLNGIISYN